MSEFRIITIQYCPCLKQNIALEKHIHEGKMHYDCLNRHKCKCIKGECANNLFDIKSLIKN